MKANRRSSLMLVGLFFLFSAPSLLAILCYQHPQWLSGTTNRGVWIKPPVKLAGFPAHHWHLVLWYPQQCREACLEKLDKLMRIRLALGRQWYDVDTCLLQEPPVMSSMEASMVRRLSAESIQTVAWMSSAVVVPWLTQQPAIFIVNPETYFVLKYAQNAASDDIYHDIKQLIASHSN